MSFFSQPYFGNILPRRHQVSLTVGPYTSENLRFSMNYFHLRRHQATKTKLYLTKVNQRRLLTHKIRDNMILTEDIIVQSFLLVKLNPGIEGLIKERYLQDWKTWLTNVAIATWIKIFESITRMLQRVEEASCHGDTMQQILSYIYSSGLKYFYCTVIK